MKHLTITISVDYTDESALRKNRESLMEFMLEDVRKATMLACIGKGMEAPPYAGDVTDKADGSVSYTVGSKVTQ